MKIYCWSCEMNLHPPGYQTDSFSLENFPNTNVQINDI
jgi:hypothetical protein